MTLLCMGVQCNAYLAHSTMFVHLVAMRRLHMYQMRLCEEWGIHATKSQDMLSGSEEVFAPEHVSENLAAFDSGRSSFLAGQCPPNLHPQLLS